MDALASRTTQLLQQVGNGDLSAQADLLSLVYDQLHDLAQAYFRNEREGHTLQPTALVHEAYIRMLGSGGSTWENRAHFFAVAARVMRNTLINHALARKAAKRGGGVVRTVLHADIDAASPDAVDAVVLEDAISRLEAMDPRKAKVVEMRFYGGMTAAETAHVLGVSISTVEADWRMARAWLASELSPT